MPIKMSNFTGLWCHLIGQKKQVLLLAMMIDNGIEIRGLYVYMYACMYVCESVCGSTVYIVIVSASLLVVPQSEY
jgi:hypothetical protein